MLQATLAGDTETMIKIIQYAHALRFQGKMAEKENYTGRILAVGISYNKETKEHDCKVEEIKDSF